MENNEQVKQQGRPSLLQIRYLIELERLGKKRGSVALIAEICGVSHGPVSRFFKSCCENGYLTEKYEFTEKGRQVLERYKKILKETEEYLKRIGVCEEDIPENIKNLIENVDSNVLGNIARSDRQMRKILNPERTGDMMPNFLGDVLEKGNWEVCFAILQMNRGAEMELSMAHRGFERLAVIRHNNRGSWLELTICDMQANSRISGAAMVGHLSSLKYENKGKLCQADIKGGKVRIPLEACAFGRNSKGNIRGMIPITVTCSVGRAHMPESTAFLIFWL